MQRALISAKIPARLKSSSLYRLDGNFPDGIAVPWKYLKLLMWDATYLDTCSVVFTTCETRLTTIQSSLCQVYTIYLIISLLIQPLHKMLFYSLHYRMLNVYNYTIHYPFLSTDPKIRFQLIQHYSWIHMH